uniref:Uncharacterized protein n=1 Tax=Anguilla anguilla TaxID=7936 RepID=A0A0E9TKS1_ANGAN
MVTPLRSSLIKYAVPGSLASVTCSVNESPQSNGSTLLNPR